MSSILLRRARELSGLTQAQAAARAGTVQSALSAYESGTKTPTPEVVERILEAIDFRPSVLISAAREQIIESARRHGACDVRVFGSIARGTDTSRSDIDLLVRFAPSRSLFDLVDLADELEALLGVQVDVISEGGLGDAHADIVRDAVPV